MTPSRTAAAMARPHPGRTSRIAAAAVYALLQASSRPTSTSGEHERRHGSLRAMQTDRRGRLGIPRAFSSLRGAAVEPGRSTRGITSRRSGRCRGRLRLDRRSRPSRTISASGIRRVVSAGIVCRQTGCVEPDDGQVVRDTRQGRGLVEAAIASASFDVTIAVGDRRVDERAVLGLPATACWYLPDVALGQSAKVHA